MATNKSKLRQLKMLMVFATIFSGILAGGNADRYIVQVPAFRHTDINCWAQYSLHADLGNGLFFYPFEAVTGFVLLVAAMVAVLSRRAVFQPAVRPVSGALIGAFLGLFFTVFAAPVMLDVKNISNDPFLLRQAFNMFHFWGAFRAVAQVLSFFASVWALAVVFAIKEP